MEISDKFRKQWIEVFRFIKHEFLKFEIPEAEKDVKINSILYYLLKLKTVRYFAAILNIKIFDKREFSVILYEFTSLAY